MRQSVGKLVKEPIPPATVMILRAHAEYLGIAPLPGSPSPIRPEGYITDTTAKPYGSVCSVGLAELYVALQTAKGVDERLVQVRGVGDQVEA